MMKGIFWKTALRKCLQAVKFKLGQPLSRHGVVDIKENENISLLP